LDIQFGHQQTALPQGLTVVDFSTTRVRNRNEPKEMKRDVVIKISMACSVMFGLRKKMTAMAPDCHTFSCAKAASCICDVAKIDYSSLQTSDYARK
jgi:hypothetical protein